MKYQPFEFDAAVERLKKYGHPVLERHEYENRRRICDGCGFWDPDHMEGLGKCMECGCSGTKLIIAASQCPIGKWVGK